MEERGIFSIVSYYFIKLIAFICNLVEDMIKEVDVDGDGRIDFYEFVHALGEPEDSQENDEEDENTTSPLLTPKSVTSLVYEQCKDF